jgi:hypothetical protein
MQEVDSKTLARAQVLDFNIEKRIEQLEVIRRWRDELFAKLWDEPADLDLENIEVWGPKQDLDALQAEVEQFKLACKGARV